MNYSGRVIDEGFRGDFLKEALKLESEDLPSRGPSFYSREGFIYRFSISGDFDWFQGYETVSKDGRIIYECYVHGGLVK